MRGTIDVQIKRKDGTIENRREHNVVFDIPSLTFKKWSESPLAIITGLPTATVVLTGSNFKKFALSEDTISTTEPSVVPPALETVDSSPSKWYYGPTTITTTTQSKNISATWTIGEALTLKSIFFYGNSSLEKIFYDYDEYILTSKDNIYAENNDTKRLRKDLMDFSGFQLNDSTSWNGLVSSTVSDAFEDAYVDYPLCNPDERFVFSYQSNSSTVYAANPTVTSTLEIRNKDTNTVVRSFPITQFTGFDVTSSSNMVKRTYVVNTGTKNVFAAVANDGKSLNLWQIPDVATTEPIPISATVLTNYCNYTETYSNQFKVAGPYISVQTQSGDYWNVARINDDFSATTYHGWAGDNKWQCYYVYNNKNRYFAKYRSGKMFLYRRNTNNNETYAPTYPNITAANFSTPIVLAEGDVLTVAYKIEVS